MAAKWQGNDFYSGNSVDVCDDICAVSDPDAPINDRLSRGAALRGTRIMLARLAVMYPGGVVDAPQLDGAFREIHLAAQECVRRIQDGECARFILNTGQYPDRLEALISYDDAKLDLGIKGE